MNKQTTANTTSFVLSTDSSKTSTSSAGLGVSVETVAPLGLLLGFIAVCANSVVLAVLLRARRHISSSVHSFIANQAAMDLFAAFFYIFHFIVMLTHGYNYNGSQILDNVICIVFERAITTSVCVLAGKIGLVVITLERYFKIVHAIAHRKYYRNWMTSVGVVLPWIGGVCFALLPSIGIIRVVNGTCVRTGVWPNRAMSRAYASFEYLFHYAIPVVVFVYCYGCILHTIRRQSKVVASHNQTVTTAATSRDQSTGQVQQQATGGATTVAKISHTELNVIKTMLTIIVCFVIFFSAPHTFNFLQGLGVASFDNRMFSLFAALAHINLCLNPLIYASRYEVFRTQLKKMLNKNAAVAPNNTGAGATSAVQLQPTGVQH